MRYFTDTKNRIIKLKHRKYQLFDGVRGIKSYTIYFWNEKEGDWFVGGKTNEKKDTWKPLEGDRLQEVKFMDAL